MANETDAARRDLDTSGREIDPLDRFRAMCRIVLGATIGFLPFLFPILVREPKIEVFTALILWTLTAWVIFNEWAHLEDHANYYYGCGSTLLHLFDYAYVLSLVLLPASLTIVIQFYGSVKVYIVFFMFLLIIDLIRNVLYQRAVENHRAEYEYTDVDILSFQITWIFDIIFLLLYFVFLLGIGFVIDWIASVLSIDDKSTVLLLEAVSVFAVYCVEFWGDWTSPKIALRFGASK